MEYDQILELVKEVSKAGLSEFEYQEGDVRIAMSYPEAKVETRMVESTYLPDANAESVSVEVEKEVPKGIAITSPIVGTFYSAPSETEDPFVKVGDHVVKGQTLGIVEAMKLMNEIESEYDGVITEICVDNTDTVEYGQELFRIKC